ncbi:MAG: response regulator receiver protein [Chitinophagaceae bacterium]|nr:response regulator receiver protein [Chitinophagaceae bacterium]
MKNEPRILLLVEDNEGDAELTIEALKNNDIRSEIKVIKNGEEALQFLKLEGDYAHETLPDLILLDINLPKIDGKEVLHFVKNDEVLKKIPVVILTTSSLQKDIAYSYNNHANCYIVKPGNLKDFTTAINSIERFWIQCVTYPKNN